MSRGGPPKRRRAAPAFAGALLALLAVPALAAPALADSAAATPGAPTAVTATAQGDAFVVRWQAPQGAIGGYRVTPYVDGETEVPQLTGSTATTATLRGLPAGSSYAFSVAALGANATGPDSAPSSAVAQGGANPIVAENRLPGDPLWGDFVQPADEVTLAGYGSKLSVLPGDSLDLYVTTTAPKVTIDVFRMGWYGGAGARHVMTLGTFPGVEQRAATPDPLNGMIEERWRRTATLHVPSGWVSGIYVARLETAKKIGAFVIFAVRGTGRSDILFQSSVTTSEAYNLYGGTSLYNNDTDKTIWRAPHAMKVSFDRPFANGDGVGYFLAYEYQTLRFLEKNGYDVSYSTDLDTHTGADPLTNHRAFLVVGHDEYWTKAMRDRVEGAIAHGVNVGFLAGNESYWQIRLEPSADGVPDRVMVGYKDFAACDDCPPGPDPVWKKDNRVLTALWRDPLVGRPESEMMGVMFGGEVENAGYVVKNASHWVYAGTGFRDGTVVPGIVGYEYDHFVGGPHTPPGVTVLSDSPVVNGETGKPDTANSAIYTAKSGARVFAAGSITWGWGLDGFGGNGFASAGMQRMMGNILANFTAGVDHATVVTAPGAPAEVSASAGDGTAVVSFAPPAADGGSAVTGYRITPYVAGVARVPVVVDATATSAAVAGLENGMPTMFTVAALNRAGAGPESSPTHLVYPTAELPAPPVVVGGAVAGATAMLSWAPPLTDGGDPVTAYRVTAYLGSEPQASVALPGIVTFAALPGLRTGARYTFAVAAVNATGAGPGSRIGELPLAGAR